MGYEPFYVRPEWNEEDIWCLTPFVTDIWGPVYTFRNLPSQLLGALFSRASRAKGDLRAVFLDEYIYEILRLEENAPKEDILLSKELREVIEFYHKHPLDIVFNSKRAYMFFAKWLAEYGDESIAQMLSTNLVVRGLSQPAIKFLEDERIGIAPIEKSTRYVNYGEKVGGRYLYKTDPRLADWGLKEEYEEVMDSLFKTYNDLLPIMIERLQKEYPEVKVSVLEKNAFDVLRGFLPMAALSQVAFHGNGQAFKYMIDRCAEHQRGELRWFAQAARAELDKEIPAILLRLDEEPTQRYQRERIERRKRMRAVVDDVFGDEDFDRPLDSPQVYLREFDPEGQEKVIAGLLFAEGNSLLSWDTILNRVRGWSDEEKDRVLHAHFSGRKERWEKIARAFENAYVRFEIIMNSGAYRDLHRHRMHTQDRQRFTTHLGYEVFPEFEEAGLVSVLHDRMAAVNNLFRKIELVDPEAAQDVPTLFHYMRFYQLQNLRQVFWEGELRTIQQGRWDYRHIEQEKFRLLQTVYSLVMKYMLIDMNEYGLARRGQEDRAKKREQKIVDALKTS